jgi:hypothetical protein
MGWQPVMGRQPFCIGFFHRIILSGSGFSDQKPAAWLALAAAGG